MRIERKAWSQEELLLVFRLYCRTPFGRLHQRNPKIIELARQIRRTPGAVAMKACNFASLDPQQQARRIKALGNVSRADCKLWEAFLNDSESIAQEAEAVYVAIAGKESDDYLPELGHAEESMGLKISQKKVPSRKGLRIPDGPTESGTHGEASYFVLAGLAVFEREIHWFRQDLDSFQAEYFPEETEPIHFRASSLRVRDTEQVEEPWSRITEVKRRELEFLCGDYKVDLGPTM